MAEPPDRNREAEHSRSPDADGPGEGHRENDLDIDTLVSVWKDDLLLDAIGGAPNDSDQLDVPYDVSADRQLIEALLSWRREIESNPIISTACEQVPHVDMDAVVRSAGRHRFRVPIVSALAAAVVLTFTAMAAYGATPNEALWPMTEVLYSEHAASVRAAHDVEADQAKARAAMAAGQKYRADAALDAAASRIPQVRAEDGRTELQNRQRDLARQFNAAPGPLAAKTPAATPAAPLHHSKTDAATPAAPNPTSPQNSHSSLRGDSPARATRTHDSTTEAGSATTTPPPRPTSRSTSATPISPQQYGQPGKPPRPTPSANATTTQPATSAVETNSRAAQHDMRKTKPAKTKSKKPPPSTPPSPQATKAAPSTAHTVKPSPSVPTTRNRHPSTTSNKSARPAPTPRERATPSPPSAPS